MEDSQTIVAFKGFDKNLQCIGFQYAVGQTFEHTGKVKMCKSGFHSCENPLKVFQYYVPGISRYALVEASGCVDTELNTNDKIVSSKLYIKAELTLPELTKYAVDWLIEHAIDKIKHSTGDYSASSATGDYSASSATGDCSASSATGDCSASSATGGYSASSATGDYSASSATGDCSASSATGDYSASSATGDCSASSATGGYSASSAMGNYSASSATGNYSTSSATGSAAVALSIGRLGRAKAGKDAAIVLCFHNGDGTLKHIRASKVGENGVKPDTWYTLNEDGDFVEV